MRSTRLSGRLFPLWRIAPRTRNKKMILAVPLAFLLLVFRFFLRYVFAKLT
jgi:hypothetical protein